MKIGDRCFVHGYIDEIRKDTVIIRNDGGYFGTIPSEIITGELPSAQSERKKGQWMKEDRGHVEYCAVCDQCGFDWIWSDREYFKFCPNCGADMRGEQDE